MNMIRGNNEHERYLITSDEALAKIIHPPAVTADQRERMKVRIVEAIQTFLELDENDSPQGGENAGIPVERHWKTRVTVDRTNIVVFSFPGQPEGSQTFSLVPLKLKDHPKDDPTPDDVLRFLRDALTDLINRYGMPEGVPGTQPNRPGLWPIDLDGRGEIFLGSIATNPLGRALHHGKATGGPGSLPVSNRIPTDDQCKFRLTGTLDVISTFRKEEGQRIFVLDTKNQPFETFPAHVREIFTADPAVEVVPFPDPHELSKLESFTPPLNHYDMCDHGTFLCSVIRFITRSAKIWLYEVLNCFGVGSFLTVAQGLAYALEQVGNDGIPTVINSSYTLEHKLPKDNSELPWHVPFDIDWGKLLHHWHDMQMRETFDSVTSYPNVIVVASAGNDAVPDEPRPPARYPAGYNNVLKVAALPKGNPTILDDIDDKWRHKVATYSNLAYSDLSSEDRSRSFAILGGDVVDGSSSPTGGILGVYIRPIPTQNEDGTILPGSEPNVTAFALWSGTSMASAILAAYLAARKDELISSNPFRPKSPETIDAKEPVFFTRQGP